MERATNRGAPATDEGDCAITLSSVPTCDSVTAPLICRSKPVLALGYSAGRILSTRPAPGLLGSARGSPAGSR